MKNNNSNNAPGWKRRLEDFEEDPSIDLHASWEKLQGKKPVKKQQHRYAFYWLTAASVALIAVLIINLNSSKTTGNTGHAVTKGDTVKAFIENRTLIINSQQPLAVQATPLLKNKIATIPQAPVVLKNNAALEEIPLLITEASSVQNISLPDSVSSPVIAGKTPPKKLKLVHINEITSGKDTNGLVQQEAKPYFPITYPTKQVYTNAGDDNKTGKDNLIRIKLN